MVSAQGGQPASEGLQAHAQTHSNTTALSRDLWMRSALDKPPTDGRMSPINIYLRLFYPPKQTLFLPVACQAYLSSLTNGRHAVHDFWPTLKANRREANQTDQVSFKRERDCQHKFSSVNSNSVTAHDPINLFGERAVSCRQQTEG